MPDLLTLLTDDSFYLDFLLGVCYSYLVVVVVVVRGTAENG